MFLKKELVLIIIMSIIMGELKMALGWFYESGHKGQQRELNKLNFQGFQTRHYNHYLHKKHKCNLERAYLKEGYIKKSRYPTLDKIVYRLDNQIDHSDKTKMTTTNPLDEWNVTGAPVTTTPSKADVYTYVTIGLKGKPSKISGKDFAKKDINVKLTELDLPTENIVFSKGFMQDRTTSSPWENEQHDINSSFEKNAKNSSEVLSNLSTAERPGILKEEKTEHSIPSKVPSWSIGQLGPRFFDGEDRKKKTTPMPYVAAHAHYDQILRMGDCHIPKEKVIKVHEVHPDPSKSYSPSCTILHQCGDDTGCCRDLKQVCKPKNTTKVELYFFTTTIGKPQTVEKLHFVNHTECECQKRTEDPFPRDSEFRRSHQKKHSHGKLPDAKKKKNHCTCPSRYSVRLLPNDSCVCDCFDKQDDCLVLKKGKAHFSYQDKLCIQSGICLVPSCEFGSYIRQFGRCPNKSEKYHYSWSRILSYRDLIT